MKLVRGSLPGLPGERDIAVLEGDTHISRWVEESRRLDHDQSALPRIGALIGGHDVVYDVGAFIGDHSCYYATRAALVVAVEAQSDAFACLAANAAPYRNISCINKALGAGEFVSLDAEREGNLGARRPRRGLDGARTIRLDELVELVDARLGSSKSTLKGGSSTSSRAAHTR